VRLGLVHAMRSNGPHSMLQLAGVLYCPGSLLQMWTWLVGFLALSACASEKKQIEKLLKLLAQWCIKREVRGLHQIILAFLLPDVPNSLVDHTPLYSLSRCQSSASEQVSCDSTSFSTGQPYQHPQPRPQ